MLRIHLDAINVRCSTLRPWRSHRITSRGCRARRPDDRDQVELARHRVDLETRRSPRSLRRPRGSRRSALISTTAWTVIARSFEDDGEPCPPRCRGWRGRVRPAGANLVRERERIRARHPDRMAERDAPTRRFTGRGRIQLTPAREDLCRECSLISIRRCRRGRGRSSRGPSWRHGADARSPAGRPPTHPGDPGEGSRPSAWAREADIRIIAAAPSVSRRVAGVTDPLAEHWRELASRRPWCRGADVFLGDRERPFRRVRSPPPGTSRRASVGTLGRLRLGLEGEPSCSSRESPYDRRVLRRFPSRGRQKGSRRPSRYIASCTVALPIRYPVRMRSSRNGTRVMFSMPPARTTSESPRAICCAPSCTAFMPEPHAMLTL